MCYAQLGIYEVEYEYIEILKPLGCLVYCFFSGSPEDWKYHEFMKYQDTLKPGCVDTHAL